MSSPEYQPRYIAYCKDQGRSTEDQMDHDSLKWPGGVMCGFILWISNRWATWKKENNWPPHAVVSETQHTAFDKWLGISND